MVDAAPFVEFCRLQGLAHSHVWNAVRAGKLPRLAHQYCVDCGSQATEYDHRDYRRPLEVDPVCHSCNLLRGAALPTFTKRRAPTPEPAKDAA